MSDNGRRNGILIVAEAVAGALPPAVLELLTLAQRLAGQAGGRIAAVLLGSDADSALQALSARGVQCVYRLQCPALALVAVEACLPGLVDACTRAQPGLVLLAHGVAGAEIAPRLAFRLDGAAATACVDIVMDGAVIRCTRPCYGGLAREVGEYAVAPVVATVRAGVFAPAPAEAAGQATIIDIGSVDGNAASVRVVERRAESGDGVRLEDARIIVAGGRGLEGPEGFTVLQQLARELDAAVGSSRVPCDLGWCPHSWQVGLTGKTVTPELYIAVGISGAGHHMAGCGNAGTIVAINSDPGAAIFQDARYGVVGDYREVVPAFADEVRKLKQAAAGYS